MITFIVFALFISAAAAMCHAICPAPHRISAADGILCLFEEDDSDIKIAGEEPVKDTDDSNSEANELEYQRKCGNLEKVRALGAALSEKIISQDGESDFGGDISEDDKTRTQRRLLLAFAAISTLEANIKSPILQGVAINVFYSAIKAALPEFYEDINESGSFSFYTLCLRRGGDIESSIGHTFAMLVGKEDDALVEELGKALYLRFVDVTLKTITSFEIKQ